MIAIAATGLVATLVGLVAAFGAWWFPVSASQPLGSEVKATGLTSWLAGLRPIPVLRVSGINADVEIHKGPAGAEFRGGEIGTTNTDSVVYLPFGQRIKLEVSGTNADVRVNAELMPYVQVINTAAGANIEEF